MKKYIYLTLAIVVVFFGNWLWIEKSVFQSLTYTAVFFIMYFTFARFFPAEEKR